MSTTRYWHASPGSRPKRPRPFLRAARPCCRASSSVSRRSKRTNTSYNRPRQTNTDQHKRNQTITSRHALLHCCSKVTPLVAPMHVRAHTHTHTCTENTHSKHTQTHHAILSEVLTARRCRSSMILSWASLRIHASRFCASHGHFAAARRFPEHSRVYDSGQETGVDCGGSGGAVWRTGVRGRCEAGEARRKRALIIFLRSLSHSLDIFSKLSVVYSCRSCAALPLLSALFVWTQVS